MNRTGPLDLLMRGATALTADPAMPMIEDAVIGVRDDRLVLVGKSSAAVGVEARRVIDARGHVATPGFVNVHTHAVLSLARGMTEDMGFAPAYTPGVPHAYDITGDEAVALGRLTALEAMLSGSTIINDMYTHAHVTLPAIAELGMRISSSAWIHDVDFTQVHNQVWDYRPTIGADRLRYAVDLHARFDGAFEGRASVMFAPHAIDTCSLDFLRDVNAERRRLGVRVMTHLAQSHMEVAQVEKRDGLTPTQVVEQAGLLDDGLIAAHCLVMTEDDIAAAGSAH